MIILFSLIVNINFAQDMIDLTKGQRFDYSILERLY